jgi:hypothetical protein
MGPQAIVVGGILAKDPAQMSLSEHHQVVDTFPSDRADESLCVPVLPWRPWRNRLELKGRPRKRSRPSLKIRRRFAAVRESVYGPSRQILGWNLMSAFGVLRTSCEADTKRIGSE